MKNAQELRRIMPDRIRTLPTDALNSPLLWFAQRGGNGLVDYRLQRPGAIDQAIAQHLCYICGQKLGRNLSFITGPVGALRQIAIDPPCHRGCATFAAQACPYYTKPRLRPDAMPAHNATCIWTTRSYTALPMDNAVHFRLGAPIEVQWWRHGEPANHEEVLRATQAALRILLDIARDDSDAAVNAVLQSVARLRQYLPGGRYGHQPGASAPQEDRGCEPRQATGRCG